MHGYEFQYLWTLRHNDGPMSAHDLAERYGSIKDWRRGDGRAASNTLRSLHKRDLVAYDRESRTWRLTEWGEAVVDA